mmetsp:Transcript_12614/g.40284  ORF Transcript_12614/g.40284 Transcript_12614/m.40284 type:complete len:228 (+) Transcript_12614:369-1052(+)
MRIESPTPAKRYPVVVETATFCPPKRAPTACRTASFAVSLQCATPLPLDGRDRVLKTRTSPCAVPTYMSIGSNTSNATLATDCCARSSQRFVPSSSLDGFVRCTMCSSAMASWFPFEAMACGGTGNLIRPHRTRSPRKDRTRPSAYPTTPACLRNATTCRKGATVEQRSPCSSAGALRSSSRERESHIDTGDSFSSTAATAGRVASFSGSGVVSVFRPVFVPAIRTP